MFSSMYEGILPQIIYVPCCVPTEGRESKTAHVADACVVSVRVLDEMLVARR